MSWLDKIFKIIKGSKNEGLKSMGDNFSEDIRAEFGHPPKVDDFLGDIEAIEEDGPEWPFRIWLEEWSESYLGSPIFIDLERRFSEIPEIEAVVHMDREVFLIRSTLEPAKIKGLIWEKFLVAAEEAKQKYDSV